MKLRRIEARNFRSLFVDADDNNFDVELSDGMNAFVGPNNCGKSNLLRAVALALDPEYFPFSRATDVPGTMAWAYPGVTLEFECDGKSSSERTLLRYADEYEKALKGGKGSTYADDGIIRYRVSYQGSTDASTRNEQFIARGKGSVKGAPELLDKALRQFRKTQRFVLIESGESLERLLEGKFREILHTVIEEHLSEEFTAATNHRDEYMARLRDTLLDPLRVRIDDVVRDLFPEIVGVTLTPHVSSTEETLSRVAVGLQDAVDTNLAAKGTGVRGGVTVAMLRYLADYGKRSMVFAVEEPEAFLHPAAQEELRGDLEGLAERRDVTLLVTTHSPYIVSREPEARLFELKKDPQGRTYCAGSVAGDEPHAALLGGLFRDAAVPDVVAQADRIPDGARGVVLVEGSTDVAYLRLACRLADRADLLCDLHLEPTEGTNRMVLHAIVLRHITSLPLMVLVDNDDPGKKLMKLLTDPKFGFQRRSEVMSIAEMFSNKAYAYEAEDLLSERLLERFIKQYGEEQVLTRKEKVGDTWSYDLNKTGKELLPNWLENKAKASDMERLVDLVLLIRERMGLGEPVPPRKTKTAEPASPVPHTRRKRKWDELSLLWAITDREGTRVAKQVKSLLDHFQPQLSDYYWGEGRSPSVTAVFTNSSGKTQPWSIWTDPLGVSINFDWMRAWGDGVRGRLLAQLCESDGIAPLLAEVAAADFKKRPTIPWEGVLEHEGTWRDLVAALDEAFASVSDD